MQFRSALIKTERELIQSLEMKLGRNAGKKGDSVPEDERQSRISKGYIVQRIKNFYEYEFSTKKPHVNLNDKIYVLLIISESETDNEDTAHINIPATDPACALQNGDEDELDFGEWWHSIRKLCWSNGQGAAVNQDYISLNHQ